MKSYGKELILDLHNCDVSKFNRRSLRKYFIKLCELIDMERCKLSWWDYYWYPKWVIKLFGWDKNPKIYGTSVVQFIMTSNITIHALPLLKIIYINVFSCKDFNSYTVKNFSKYWFRGEVKQSLTIERI